MQSKLKRIWIGWWSYIRMKFSKNSWRILNALSVVNWRPNAAVSADKLGTAHETASYANGKNTRRCVHYLRWIQRKTKRKRKVLRIVRKRKHRRNLWFKSCEVRLYKQNIQTILSNREALRYRAGTFCLFYSKFGISFSRIFLCTVDPYYKWCSGNLTRHFALPIKSRKRSHGPHIAVVHFGSFGLTSS